MPFSLLKTSHLLVAFLGFTLAFSATPQAFAQDAPPADETEIDENAPIVPAVAFPSLIALDQGNKVWTLKVSNGRLKVNGDVIVNSTNRGALWIADGSIAVQKGIVNVAGNVSRLGRTSIDPVPTIGAGAVEDPFPKFSVEPPDEVISNEKLFLQTEAGGDDTVLPPGIYDGGIFASGNGHITLKPGLFIINNGDFSAIGPTVEGEGVTIVMGGAKPGALDFSLSARFNASAPTSGKMKDLLVISRMNNPLASGIRFAVAQARLKGILYSPNAPISVQSKSSVQVGKVIARALDVTASTVDITGLLSGDAAPPTPALSTPAATAETEQ
jgi:hypothetical protein